MIDLHPGVTPEKRSNLSGGNMLKSLAN